MKAAPSAHNQHNLCDEWLPVASSDTGHYCLLMMGQKTEAPH